MRQNPITEVLIPTRIEASNMYRNGDRKVRTVMIASYTASEFPLPNLFDQRMSPPSVKDESNERKVR